MAFPFAWFRRLRVRVRRRDDDEGSSSDVSDSSSEGRGGNLNRGGKCPPRDPIEPERAFGAMRR